MYRMSQMSQSVRSVRYCVRFGRYRSKPLTETNLAEDISKKYDKDPKYKTILPQQIS